MTASMFHVMTASMVHVMTASMLVYVTHLTPASASPTCGYVHNAVGLCRSNQVYP
jgi:hypothetical protein